MESRSEVSKQVDEEEDETWLCTIAYQKLHRDRDTI